MTRIGSHARFICGLLLAASLGAGADTNKSAKSVPTFYAPGLVDVGQPFQLSAYTGFLDVKSWAVQWGEGAEENLDKSLPVLTHTYAKPGPYAVSVAALLTDGTRVPAAIVYGQLTAEDHPAVFLNFLTHTAEGTWFQNMNHPPAWSASRLPWGENAVAFGGDAVSTLASRLPASDRFTFDFWWKPTDLKKRQEIFLSDKSGSAEFFLKQSKLTFQPAKGAIYVQPLPDKFAMNIWHYVTLTYDRAPLFPYSNRARFYLDGVLIGDQHLDVYDTGEISCGKAIIGSSPNGSNRLRGEVADIAFYTTDLPPHRLLEHAHLFTAPGKRTVFATAAVKNPIFIVLPTITQTVSVPLDPAPDADNGPAFRKVLQDATPGTRLEVIEKTTGRTGGTYHFHTLDTSDSTVFRLVGRRDLEIDGQGATFVFSQPSRQFYLQDCQRVALRNFAMDLDQTKYRVGVYARILDLDLASGNIRFQFVNGRDLTPDRAVPPDISMSHWQPHDPKTLGLTEGPSFKTNDTLQGNPKRDPNDASIITSRVKREMILTLEDYRKGANFFLINNAVSSNRCMEIGHSSQLTFDHLSFYASLGPVFQANGVNHVHVVDCKIGLPPGLTAADRPLAAAAGGFRFRDSQGDLLLERNEIALVDGDTITMKDEVWLRLHALDQFTIAMPHVRIGDEIELFGEDFSPLHFSAYVVAVNKDAARLDQSLPADLPESFLGMSHTQHTQNWILSGNDLHDNYGGLQLCTPNGLVRGNRITQSWLHLGAHATAFDHAGISSSVTVYDNLLINTSADTSVWGIETKFPVFQNIAFDFNSFIGAGLKLNNADSPQIVGNYFETGGSGFETKDSNNAVGQDNTVIAPTKTH